jgi:hypothetical protein
MLRKLWISGMSVVMAIAVWMPSNGAAAEGAPFCRAQNSLCSDGTECCSQVCECGEIECRCE